ncbi:HAD-IIB family hydrolase [Candidatus Phytoplasma pruni]|uniref:HAD-IIB family hydrolase n=1 Tax=Candidatus Phytoplasma pruni TaxID=479893 RepID=A0A851HGB7_9MOLU|nr:HAD-IIB family hydrolase [Candidatus Phytoplasma pruni]NWN45680.1 HAD-IIB family hydrolase [Candidatus Phytoplasma pruni]
MNMNPKRLFFFDIDHTLYYNEQKEILSQTKKLLIRLSQNPNNILGIATGRSYRGTRVLKELTPLFKYFVVLNGAITYEGDKIIQDTPISSKDVIELNQKALEKQILVVNVEAQKKGILEQKDPDSQQFMQDIIAKKTSKAFNLLNLDKPIYKMNLSHANHEVIVEFLKDFPQLHAYFWKNGVVSLSAKQVNKAYGIQPIQQKYPDYQLIGIGDGCNDIEMFQAAHLSIVMNNTKYPYLKKIAHLIAPTIEDNQLYAFFVQHGLV